MREKKKSLVGFKTIKWVCHSCNRHYATLPIMQGLDKGDECTYCGNTSFITKPGRMIGKKSRQFSYWLNLYNDVKAIMPKEYLGAIYRESEV